MAFSHDPLPDGYTGEYRDTETGIYSFDAFGFAFRPSTTPGAPCKEGMRTVVYLQPGERRGCVGCHEPPGSAPDPRLLASTLRPPSVIEPGPDGTRPFGYPRLVQPLLDLYCTRCHDGAPGLNKSEPVLTGSLTDSFSRSYKNLLPYLRWPSQDSVTRPGGLGADASPLSAILTGDKHRAYVQLPDEHLRTLYLWLDAYVPFFGTYEEDGLRAQRLGQAVPAPQLQ